VTTVECFNDVTFDKSQMCLNIISNHVFFLNLRQQGESTYNYRDQESGLVLVHILKIDTGGRQLVKFKPLINDFSSYDNDKLSYSISRKVELGWVYKWIF